LLRQEVRDGTPRGLSAREYMSRGELVPDEVVLDVVLRRMASGQVGRSFVLDGFPRNVSQARALDQALAARGQRVDHVIAIEVPRLVLLDRLKVRAASTDDGGRPRSDDRPDTVERRLAVYEGETAPLREYYRASGVLREIDGDRPVADVTRQILRVLGCAPA